MRKLTNAKVNIALNIIGKKDNGYHELRMINVPISLSDEIFIHKEKKDLIVICDNVKEENNIVYKVLKAFKEKYKVDSGLMVRIIKRIPMEAGLGGGSSDAATVLKVANEIWKVNLSLEELASFSLPYGSDIPFFIYNKVALVWGIGENIEILNAKKRMWVLLFKPEFGFSTKEMYGLIRSYEDKCEKIHIIKEALSDGDVGKICLNMFNDFEQIFETCGDKCKKIKEIEKNMMQCDADSCIMSGSGSAVFSVFATKKKAKLVMMKMLAMGYSEKNLFICHTLK